MLLAGLSGWKHTALMTPSPLSQPGLGCSPDSGAEHFTLCWWLRNTHLQGTDSPASAEHAGGAGRGAVGRAADWDSFSSLQQGDCEPAADW